MERQSVTSSNIASIGHDPNGDTLEVEFHSGKVYQYDNVPASVAEALINAPSIGRYFSEVIRPVYDGRMVEG